MQHRLPTHGGAPARSIRSLRAPLTRTQPAPSHAAQVHTESCSSICAARQGSFASTNAKHLPALHICTGARQRSFTPTNARCTSSWLGLGRLRVEAQADEMSESAEHGSEGVECVGWLTGHAHLSWLLRVQHEQQGDLALRLPWRASRDLNLSIHPHRRFNSGRVGPISAARGGVSRSSRGNGHHCQRFPMGLGGRPGLQKSTVFCYNFESVCPT